MKIVDLYSALLEMIEHPLEGRYRGSYSGTDFFSQNPEFHFLESIARSWGLDQNSIREWMLSPLAQQKRASALAYIRESREIVTRIETVFKKELPGVLVLMPSFGDFDGFARYDLGHHQVMLGIDFPDSDLQYMKALTAHELSHVYRDHAPEVWSHLGKPLREVKRKEYLDAGTAQEHLVSEGLATLFSHALFPEIPEAVHHYYETHEWEWCVQHADEIEEAFLRCLKDDEDVWSFYSEEKLGKGSPSRLQYYWAAKKIRSLIGEPRRSLRELVSLHEKPAKDFHFFNLKSKAKS